MVCKHDSAAATRGEGGAAKVNGAAKGLDDGDCGGSSAPFGFSSSFSFGDAASELAVSDDCSLDTACPSSSTAVCVVGAGGSAVSDIDAVDLVVDPLLSFGIASDRRSSSTLATPAVVAGSTREWFDALDDSVRFDFSVAIDAEAEESLASAGFVSTATLVVWSVVVPTDGIAVGLVDSPSSCSCLGTTEVEGSTCDCWPLFVVDTSTALAGCLL